MGAGLGASGSRTGSFMISSNFLLAGNEPGRDNALNASRILDLDPLVVLTDLRFCIWFKDHKLRAKGKALDQRRIADDGLLTKGGPLGRGFYLQRAPVIGSRGCWGCGLCAG